MFYLFSLHHLFYDLTISKLRFIVSLIYMLFNIFFLLWALQPNIAIYIYIVSLFHVQNLVLIWHFVLCINSSTSIYQFIHFRLSIHPLPIYQFIYFHIPYSIYMGSSKCFLFRYEGIELEIWNFAHILLDMSIVAMQDLHLSMISPWPSNDLGK